MRTIECEFAPSAAPCECVLIDRANSCGEAIIFGTAKSHLILVYLWTEEARQDAIVDLHNAVIEKTTRLQLRRGETEDLNRALQLQNI